MKGSSSIYDQKTPIKLYGHTDVFEKLQKEGENLYFYAINCNKDGTFELENRVLTFVKVVLEVITIGLLNFTEKRYVNWAKCFIRTFKEMEAYSLTNLEEDVKKVLTLSNKVTHLFQYFNTTYAIKQLNKLKLNILSLDARLDTQPVVSEFVEHFQNKYENKLLKFAAKHVDLKNRPKEELFARLPIEAIKSYPSFFNQIISNEEELDKFFTFIYLHGNKDIRTFVEFYSTAKKLMKCGVSKLTGLFDKNKHLQFEDGKKKDLTMLFEGKHVSILNPETIATLKNGYELTVNKIFECFKNREHLIGNVCYSEEGVINWNTNELGVYNPTTDSYDKVDLTEENWIEGMPIFKTMTKEDFKKEYLDFHIEDKTYNENTHLEKGQVFTSLVSTAGSDEGVYNLLRTHTYTCFARVLEDGNVAVYYVGFFPKVGPQPEDSFFSKMSFVVNHSVGRVHWVDYSVFARDRRIGYDNAKIVDEKQFFTNLSNELQDIMNDKRPYQILTRNCMNWAFKILEVTEEEKKKYEVNFLEASPDDESKYIHKFLTIFPNFGSFIYNFVVMGILQPNTLVLDGIEYTLKKEDLPWNLMGNPTHPTVVVDRCERRKSQRLSGTSAKGSL